MFCGKKETWREKRPRLSRKKCARTTRDLFLFYDHESASKSEIPKMILSNDQKHAFTNTGARALLERKICAEKKQPELKGRR